jgi:hypothetical protein
MYSVGKVAHIIANEFQVRLVYRRCGLQGMPSSLASRLSRSDPMLFVNK